MAKFADTFLSEVSKYSLCVSGVPQVQGELSPQIFQKKLHQLVKNVHASSELTSIPFECGCENFPQKEKNLILEQERIKQLQDGLILMAQVPSGRELLSHMPLNVYMYAMTQTGKGFFSEVEKMLSISSRCSILWGAKKQFIKTLAHEMTHARHTAFLQNQTRVSKDKEWTFSPKAFFFESVFDELGARLMAEKIYSDLCKAGKINNGEKYRSISVSGMFSQMENSGYFHHFAQEIADTVGKDMNKILDEDDTLNQTLGQTFSYYMKLHPSLRQKNILDKIEAQYRKLILYPAGRFVGLNRYKVNRRFKDLGYGK